MYILEAIFFIQGLWTETKKTVAGSALSTNGNTETTGTDTAAEKKRNAGSWTQRYPALVNSGNKTKKVRIISPFLFLKFLY